MIEKERKFICNYIPEEQYTDTVEFIKQAYLMVDKERQLRVRIIDNEYDTFAHAYICYKSSTTNSTIRNEYEYEIPLKDGIELFESSNYQLIKTRYKTTFHDKVAGMIHKVDIDVYPNGLQIVEIEFENELKSLPDYCGQEVTGQTKYSNIFIAMNKNNEK